MELQVDLLDEINFRQLERQKAFSWETNDETTSNPPQICASECTLFPFAPEICTESLLPNRDKITARIVKNESDLVMDFAFLLCGWESRSILIHSNNILTFFHESDTLKPEVYLVFFKSEGADSNTRLSISLSVNTYVFPLPCSPGFVVFHSHLFLTYSEIQLF